ncbi:MAG: hypothetical protein R2695_20505 [Acidimicrobiales bacterium]
MPARLRALTGRAGCRHHLRPGRRASETGFHRVRLGPGRASLLAVGFASGRWPSVPTHRLVRANASVVGVLAAGLDRDQLVEVHAELTDLGVPAASVVR